MSNNNLLVKSLPRLLVTTVYGCSCSTLGPGLGRVVVRRKSFCESLLFGERMSFRHSTRVTGSASAGISTSAARRHPTGFPTSYSGHYSPHAFQVLPPTGIAQATSLAQGPVQFLAGYRLALGQRLSASTSSVTEVIQRHGGEVIDAQLSANITVLVAAPEDVAEVTEPVSICNGLGVLIVREDWLKFSINSGRALPFHQFIYIVCCAD